MPLFSAFRACTIRWIIMGLALVCLSDVSFAEVIDAQTKVLGPDKVNKTGDANVFKEVSGLKLKVNSQAGGRVLLIATLTTYGNKAEGVDRIGSYRIIDNQNPAASSSIIDRFVEGAKSKDRGIVVLSDLFDHPGGGDVEYKVQHKTSVASKEIATYGHLVAIPLFTTTPIVLEGGSNTSDTGSQTASISYVPVLGATANADLPAGQTGSFFVIASFNQKYVDAPGTGHWKLQYQPPGAPGGVWTDLGAEVMRTLDSSSDAGAVNVSALLRNQGTAGTYSFRLVHRAESGYILNTTAVDLSVFGTAFTGGYFETFEFASQGTTDSTTLLPTIPSIEFILANASEFFMYTGFTVSGSGPVRYSQFKQQIEEMSPNPGIRYDGTVMKRNASDTAVGSGAIADISSEIETSDTNLFRFMIGKDDTESNSNTVTFDALTQGIALTSGTVFGTTTHALVTDLAAHASGGSGAVVAWVTGSEMGSLGFHLERLDRNTGEYRRLNTEPVPAGMQAPGGARYAITDPGAAEGDRVTYRLVEIETGGKMRSHGPFTVRVGAADPMFEEKSAIFPAAVKPSANQIATQGANRLPLVQAKPGRAAPGKSKNNVDRLRIRTAGKGLHYLPNAELAKALGMGVLHFEKLLRKNWGALSNRGKSVSYLEDENGLWFYAESADSNFTQENVYWLAMEPGRGKRIPGVSGRTRGTYIPTAFRDTLHVEENNRLAPFVPDDPLSDLWYWDFTVAGTAGSDLDFEAPGVAGTGDATLDLVLSSSTAPSQADDYLVRFMINGHAIGELRWDGYAPVPFQARFDASMLLDGANTLQVKVDKNDGAPLGVFWVDGFDLAYERNFKAADNALEFSVQGNGTVEVGGFDSEDIQVFDISDPKRLFQVNNFRIDKRPDYHSAVIGVRSGHRYLATTVAAAPVAIEPAAAFDPDEEAEYLVITPASLEPGATRLADYRSARFSTRVVDLQSIYDTFNHGLRDPAAIQDFLAHAYHHWQSPPRFVVLAGKGTMDPRNHSGLVEDLVPVLMTPTPDGLFISDAEFADLEGDDGLPEVALGRIPARNDAELQVYVDKLVRNEQSGPLDGLSRAVFLADDPGPVAPFDGQSAMAASRLPGSFEKQLLHYQAGDSVPVAREWVIEQWNAGAALFNYVGHGSPSRLADETFLHLDDLGLLANEHGSYPVFLAMSCAVGNGGYPGYDALAEKLVLHPSGGAMAAVAPTGLSADGEAFLLNKALLDYLFASDTATLGESMMAAYAEQYENGGSRYMRSIYSLVGDPAIIP